MLNVQDSARILSREILKGRVGAFSTLQAPATNLTDLQGPVGCNQQALLLFGKDLGKKSLFPCQSQAIRLRKTPPAFPQHRVRLSWKYACNSRLRYCHYVRGAACEFVAVLMGNPWLWHSWGGRSAALVRPHASHLASLGRWFGPCQQSLQGAAVRSSEFRDVQAACSAFDQA